MKYEDEYILTDPCINSLTNEFGVTDLGKAGILEWFSHHNCSKFCDPDWKKPKSNFK